MLNSEGGMLNLPRGLHPFSIHNSAFSTLKRDSYPARIRTLTKSTKNSCATVTPRGSERQSRKGCVRGPRGVGRRTEGSPSLGFAYPSGSKSAEPLDVIRPPMWRHANRIDTTAHVKTMPLPPKRRRLKRSQPLTPQYVRRILVRRRDAHRATGANTILLNLMRRNPRICKASSNPSPKILIAGAHRHPWR